MNKNELLLDSLNTHEKINSIWHNTLSLKRFIKIVDMIKIITPIARVKNKPVNIEVSIDDCSKGLLINQVIDASTDMTVEFLSWVAEKEFKRYGNKWSNYNTKLLSHRELFNLYLKSNK